MHQIVLFGVNPQELITLFTNSESVSVVDSGLFSVHRSTNFIPFCGSTLVNPA